MLPKPCYFNHEIEGDVSLPTGRTILIKTVTGTIRVSPIRIEKTTNMFIAVSTPARQPYKQALMTLAQPRVAV